MLSCNFPSDLSIDRVKQILKNGSSEELKQVLSIVGESVEAFKLRVKDPATNGKELKQPIAQVPGINEFCQTELARKLFTNLTAKALDFLIEVADQLHPAHDLRHVLLKDPLASLQIIQHSDLQEHEKLAFIGGLLHDSGRAIELLVEDKIKGGVSGDKHTQYSFLVMNAAINTVKNEFRRELSGPNSELAEAIFDELLNAVLDHQSGNSKQSPIAQIVQSADRLELVGFEMAFRGIVFDVGLQGAKLFPDINASRQYALPLPGRAAIAEYNLLEHLEFYARNLFENYGEFAQQKTRELKSQSIRFIAECLLADCTPASVENLLVGDLDKIEPRFLQIFYPEIIEFRKGLNLPVPEHEAEQLGTGTKKRFSPEIFWQAFSVEKGITLDSLNHIGFYHQQIVGKSLAGVLRESLNLILAYNPAKFVLDPDANQEKGAEEKTAFDAIVQQASALDMVDRVRFKRAIVLMNFINQATDLNDLELILDMAADVHIHSDPIVQVYAQRMKDFILPNCDEIAKIANEH